MSKQTVAIIREQPGQDIYSFANGQQSVILPPISSRDLFAVVAFTESGEYLALHSAGRAASYFPNYGPDMKLYQSVLSEFKWDKKQIDAAREALGDKNFVTVDLDSLQA